MKPHKYITCVPEKSRKDLANLFSRKIFQHVFEEEPISEAMIRTRSLSNRPI